jgi:hypothetical protein
MLVKNRSKLPENMQRARCDHGVICAPDRNPPEVRPIILPEAHPTMNHFWNVRSRFGHNKSIQKSQSAPDRKTASNHAPASGPHEPTVDELELRAKTDAERKAQEAKSEAARNEAAYQKELNWLYKDVLETLEHAQAPGEIMKRKMYYDMAFDPDDMPKSFYQVEENPERALADLNAKMVHGTKVLSLKPDYDVGGVRPGVIGGALSWIEYKVQAASKAR